MKPSPSEGHDPDCSRHQCAHQCPDLVPGSQCDCSESWREGQIEVVVCPALLAELNEKLALPRIRNRYAISDQQIASVVAGLSEAAVIVPGIAVVDPLCPDADDTMLFAAAIEAGADVLVTGDKSLLAFAWPGNLRVVSPRQFLDVLRRTESQGQ